MIVETHGNERMRPCGPFAPPEHDCTHTYASGPERACGATQPQTPLPTAPGIVARGPEAALGGGRARLPRDRNHRQAGDSLSLHI